MIFFNDCRPIYCSKKKILIEVAYMPHQISKPLPTPSPKLRVWQGEYFFKFYSNVETKTVKNNISMGIQLIKATIITLWHHLCDLIE